MTKVITLFFVFLFPYSSFSKWKIPQEKQIKFQPHEDLSQKPNKKLNPHVTLPDRYLNQVIRRKKINIQTCSQQMNMPFKNILVELTILPSGKTNSRLINTEQQNQTILNCVMDVLNNIKFKKFSGPPIIKSFLLQSINKGY